MDFASFIWSLICKCNLPSPSINIIIASFFTKYLHFEVLRMESMITIEILMLKKCKNEVDQKYFVQLS